jgi:AcrR family transcriptional regulator
MTPAARARARRGEGERLREELVDATEQLIEELGDADAVSIRAICDAVGVSPPSVYLHFADKDQLLFAVCARVFSRLDDVMNRAAATAGDDPVEALRRRGQAYVRYGLEHPENYRLLFMAKPSGPPEHLDQVHMPGSVAFVHLQEAVQACVDCGAFRPDVDAYMAAVAIWTGVHGVTSLLISIPDFPWPERDALVANICANQVRALSV